MQAALQESMIISREAIYWVLYVYERIFADGLSHLFCFNYIQFQQKIKESLPRRIFCIGEYVGAYRHHIDNLWSMLPRALILMMCSAEG